MSDIFISYAKEDRVWAESLAQRLRKRGWSVFWDRTIPTGKTWRGVVGKELEDAHCVIVLWSDASISSDWVHEEADDGRQRGILLPVFKENVIPPIGFRHIQAEDLTNWDNKEDSLAFLGLTDDIRHYWHRLFMNVEPQSWRRRASVSLILVMYNRTLNNRGDY